jgi:PhnB protein
MGKVKAVPDGYSTITCSLSINGAAKAIEFYKKAFGAEERHRTASPDGKIMHAELKLGTSILMIADAMPGMGEPTRSSMHLYVGDADAAWQRATAAGAKVVMPIMNQFWGDRWGMVADEWGNRWGIASHIEDVPADQMPARMAEAMKNMPKPQQ